MGVSDERDIRHEDGDETAAVARPSGKRSARRARAASSSAVATIERPSDSAKATTKKSGKDKKAGRGGMGNPFVRLLTFLKQVVAELRKVIWPNRKQMVTYTSVVLVFVIFVIAYISGLDLAFIKGVNWLFG
ncbi:preprotein translocase subunit SecE [Nocardia seriolae]|uniref:Protein translocase subunit SecE n=1 Tax=Nocardia seriolae TaxID=37332 RepID=A0A0B8NEH9_9NOCA|nr:preprotein translocase subunit SecE [Nocardia seriolae]MTJ73348.1 preprotein translocase subunit SecE [Nocardia seriolae]MTJ84497.1 preprotein translocase subunit SecE [Nocardia seriolae]MTK28484.1 preprotein translocase subunit SecE [Nocardia seriolae]MTK38618.1 preprotein translocase subunit SecE [Nocardia seriolae]